MPARSSGRTKETAPGETARSCLSFRMGLGSRLAGIELALFADSSAASWTANRQGRLRVYCHNCMMHDAEQKIWSLSYYDEISSAHLCSENRFRKCSCASATRRRQSTGTLNSTSQNVHTPIAGTVPSHLITRRLRFTAIPYAATMPGEELSRPIQFPCRRGDVSRTCPEPFLFGFVFSLSTQRRQASFSF
jgi:hypothetical protein